MKKYLRKYTLEKVYNLTEEEYQKIFLEQAGKCAICNKEFSKTPQVDHCHSTQKVRGLLCWSCNILLGMVEKGLTKNENLLKKIIEYLK